MITDPLNDTDPVGENRSAPGTGNASNPSPSHDDLAPAPNNQLLDEKAEKYIREVASIEDLPDPEEAADAEEQMRKGKQEQ